MPQVSVSDDGIARYLHLGTPWVQGSMKLKEPFEIDLEYVQRMMAWLLFVDLDTLTERKAVQLGLGAAALTKFHYKKLKMHTSAVEINPLVVNICRTWFKLPHDNDMLEVVLGDASMEILKPRWQGAVDALQVDLYDHNAAAPVLDSVEFYSDCRNMLTPEGCMTVNLFGRASSYQRSLDKITEAFGQGHVWAFKPTREGNTIVLAQRVPTALSREELQVRAEAVQARFGLPASKWLKVFKQVMDTPPKSA
ncbi:MAG: spermidine synthase [Comamonas sp.]|nr:spermidine synthase [Comamonas sp.]